MSGATRTGYKSLVAAASNVTEGWVDLSDEAATARLAGRVAREARRGDAIALSGELGAGKTSFARAFIRACGAPEEVPSPSFTLVQTYDTPRGAVSHFDLYRLSRPEEIEELGLDEALAEGIVLIEWPDRLPRAISDAVLVHIDHGEGDARTIRITNAPDGPPAVD